MHRVEGHTNSFTDSSYRDIYDAHIRQCCGLVCCRAGGNWLFRAMELVCIRCRILMLYNEVYGGGLLCYSSVVYRSTGVWLLANS